MRAINWTRRAIRGCLTLAATSLTLLASAQASDQEIAPLSSLPVSAQSTISAAIGRDNPGYFVHATRDGFDFANYRQQLSVRFNSSGVSVRSEGVHWELTFAGYGRGDVLRFAPAPVPQAELNRLEYRRGPLTEWYVNGPSGIEQGFTVSEPLPRSDRRPLTIALSLSEGLVVKVDQDLRGVTLTSDKGAGLRYAGLAASDASGRSLPAWVEVSGTHLLLHVDDARARYPVVIDPIVQLAELNASDGGVCSNPPFCPQPKLGASVSISGNTVAVGAPQAVVGGLNNGAVYVFERPWTGTHAKPQSEVGKCEDDYAEFGAQFGASVAMSGGNIAIGAPLENCNGACNGGAVYVCNVPPGSGWTTGAQNVLLPPLDLQSGDEFGFSVAISGNTLVAGAPFHAASGGAAYVFQLSQGSWGQVAELTASDGGGLFGLSVGINGNTIAVGAPNATVNGRSARGAVYVFVKHSGGWTNMTQSAKLIASDGLANDSLGVSVGVSGSTVIAGAPEAKVGSNARQGAAYLFVKPGNSRWKNAKQTAKLTASDGAASDGLGVSVAVTSIRRANGTVIQVAIVGAIDPTINGNVHQGAAYEFVEPSTGWKDATQTAKLTASDGGAQDYFGWAVAIAGTTVVVGAPDATINGFVNQGKAYVFGP